MRRLCLLTMVALAGLSSSGAWDAHGHRVISYLALDGLGGEAPGWLREMPVRHRIAFQSNERDRWRGWPALALRHRNNPDHYLDVDLLGPFGLRLETLPPLRREYLRALILAKREHPGRVRPYDAGKDPARIREWPGFLPHAIAEEYAILQAALHEARILESLGESRRQHQLEQARANAIYHMGMLAHLVGDASQPLHTTKHYNGWVGKNPHHYTTDRSFHAFIDGRLLRIHDVTYASARERIGFDRKVDPEDPWTDVLAFLQRSFDRVEPLYRLERDGKLAESAGRELALECLQDGVSMLAALYRAAWASTAPTKKQIEDWVRFNDFRPELLPGPGGERPAGVQSGRSRSRRSDR
jgi:hypothetical protein